LTGNAATTPAVKVAKKDDQPISLRNFALSFRPGPNPGRYNVTFIHPRSGNPVNVTFDLPAGTPRIAYDSGGVVFDYGTQAVVIRFLAGDKAVVSPY